MRFHTVFAGLFLAVTGASLLAGCSEPAPPLGRWEGGYEANGIVVAARVEIGANGLVRVSAPDMTDLQNAKPEQLLAARQRVAAELATDWETVKPRRMDFDGKTFRNPGGVAPQMVWDKASNQMMLELFLGNNQAMPVPLRAVDGFHDNPWASG